MKHEQRVIKPDSAGIGPDARLSKIVQCLIGQVFDVFDHGCISAGADGRWSEHGGGLIWEG
eukprot:7344737-Pyramimonas_sp.AAC.1